jgi:hypothetical protein
MMKLRSRKGGMVTLVLIGMIPLLIAFGAFAVDMKHQQTAQQQLQKATDAAALAGAEMLWYDGTYSMAGASYTPDTTYPVVKQKALQVASLNIADGRSVSTSTTGVTINVTVQDPKLPTVPPPLLSPLSAPASNLAVLPLALVNNVLAQFTPSAPGASGTVQVQATMPVRNILGSIIGRPTDTVTATSTAGASGTLYSANAGQLFPLSVSWLSVPSVSVAGLKVIVDLPLILKRIGDPIQIQVDSGLTQNAAFTSFTTGSAVPSYVPQAIDQYIGNVPLVTDDPTKVIPPVKVGQSINAVGDIGSANKMAAEAANLSGKVLYMPVVITNLGALLGPLGGLLGVGNLISSVSALATQLLGLNDVVGFVAVKVDNVSVAPGGVLVIKGMVVNGARFGSTKPLAPGGLLTPILGLVNSLLVPGPANPLTATQAVKLLQ